MLSSFLQILSWRKFGFITFELFFLAMMIERYRLTPSIIRVVLIANLVESFFTNIEVLRYGQSNHVVKYQLRDQYKRISLRGGCDTNNSEDRCQMDSSVKAFFRGCGIVGHLFALTVIYSADTGSVSLGNA